MWYLQSQVEHYFIQISMLEFLELLESIFNMSLKHPNPLSRDESSLNSLFWVHVSQNIFSWYYLLVQALLDTANFSWDFCLGFSKMLLHHVCTDLLPRLLHDPAAMGEQLERFSFRNKAKQSPIDAIDNSHSNFRSSYDSGHIPVNLNLDRDVFQIKINQ